MKTQAILKFLAKHQGKWSTWGKGYSMPTVQEVIGEETSKEEQLEIMTGLYEEGFIGGCMCGCRGDFEITDLGLAYIGEQREKPYSGYGHKAGTITTGMEGQIALLERFGYTLELEKIETSGDPDNKGMLSATATMRVIKL